MRKTKRRKLATLWLTAATTMTGALLGSPGCSDDQPPEPPAGEAPGEAPSDALLADDLVVPIAREIDAATLAARRDALAPRFDRPGLRGAQHRSGTSAPGDFYLAIRKNALSERWFLSMFLKEVTVFGPSPFSLGTKVVRFRQQNGKLYVFDADERRATSDVFNPDLIIDAFPIVESSRFHAMPGSGGYILIDPAAGGNRFSAVNNLFGGGTLLETELSYVEGFKRYDDGASYEQIISAYSRDPLGAPDDSGAEQHRLAATMRVSLRTYSETPGFQRVEAPPVPHYFVGEAYVVKNQGYSTRDAVKWGFYPGMQPIKWLLSPRLAELSQSNPNGADLVAAAKRGIEAWNDVIGYPVFEAELDTSGEALFAEDRVNYVLVDTDLSQGYAYADWRTNPNTSEIRGAFVYFGAPFFTQIFQDDPPALAPGAAPPQLPSAPQPRPPVKPGLSWQGIRREPLCVLHAEDLRDAVTPPAGAITAQYTAKEKMERYIEHTMTHEIGHIMGLRHNFKGSLVPPSSSVMEYSIRTARIAQPGPGPYDHQAIDFLYGQTPDLPTLPFCNDGDIGFDPNCVPSDAPSATPLIDFQIPRFAPQRDAVLDGTYPPEFAATILLIYGSQLLDYVRFFGPEATLAWEAALGGARAPQPWQHPGADALIRAVYSELFVNPLSFPGTPPSDEAVLLPIFSDAEGFLIDADHTHSFATRRVLVDALKNAQHLSAYLALLEARAAIAATLPGLPLTEHALTQDLLARIDQAINPYFE